MHSSLLFQFGTWNKTGKHSWTWCFSWSAIWDILQLPQIRSTTFWNSTNASPSQSYITLEVVESGNGTRGVRTIFEGWLFARSIVRLRQAFPSFPLFLFRDIFVVGRVWFGYIGFSFFRKKERKKPRIFIQQIQYFHLVILLNNYYDKIIEELITNYQFC